MALHVTYLFAQTWLKSLKRLRQSQRTRRHAEVHGEGLQSRCVLIAMPSPCARESVLLRYECAVLGSAEKDWVRWFVRGCHHVALHSIACLVASSSRNVARVAVTLSKACKVRTSCALCTACARVYKGMSFRTINVATSCWNNHYLFTVIISVHTFFSFCITCHEIITHTNLFIKIKTNDLLLYRSFSWCS